MSVAYWYVAIAVLLVVGLLGWYFIRRTQRRKRGFRTKETQVGDRREQEAGQAWIEGPSPPLSLPERFTDDWFATNVPSLHPGQVPELLRELRLRGWSQDRIDTQVGAYLALNEQAVESSLVERHVPSERDLQPNAEAERSGEFTHSLFEEVQAYRRAHPEWVDASDAEVRKHIQTSRFKQVDPG